MGVGVRPENKLAVDAGLEVGPRGGIRVNEHLQTSDPDIYAVGDAIEVQDFVTKAPHKYRWPGQQTVKAESQPTMSSDVRVDIAGHKVQLSCGSSKLLLR